MANELILVVDDNPANLKLARVLLLLEGFRVSTASNTQEALAALAGDELPRLVLMDLQMPGMDGFELTRKLRRDEKTQTLIIVALTAYAMKGDEQRARDAGCDGYLAKPLDTRTLGKTLRAYLEARTTPAAH